MLKFEQLPKKTPRWLAVSIFLTGGCLGYAIGVNALVALYGIFGFMANFFFPNALTISTSEAISFGVFGLVAGITAIMLSFLAYDMNVLSRKAIFRSRIMWIPTLVTSALLWLHHVHSSFQYHLSIWWPIITTATIIFGGFIPALLLGSKAAQKVHNR
jgi:hypothetical protein